MSQRKQLSAAEKRDLLKEGLTPDEIKHLEIQLDPVIWAETFLRDPERPSKPLKVRFYQKEMLRCEARKKVYRCGRRIGKSIVLCIEMLWKAFCNEGKRILVCAPYKNQVQLLWKDGFNKLIRGNKFIEASISNMTQNPFAIYFKNGSRISGLTAGSKTGNKGTSIRGQNADDLYLDEVDYMGDEAIHSIMAIIATKEFGRFIISSTPTGRREFFYDACTNKYLGYHQFHYPSSASPEWVSIEDARRRNLPLHESQEYLFRNQCPEHVYQHEYDAEFGEEAQGVFKHKFIGSSLVLYDPEKEEIDPEGKYCSVEKHRDQRISILLAWTGMEIRLELNSL
jgi:replicative DNA helicase